VTNSKTFSTVFSVHTDYTAYVYCMPSGSSTVAFAANWDVVS